MNDQIVIQAQELGKKYLIGHDSSAGRSKTFREAVAASAKGAIRSVKNMARLRQIVSGDQIEEFSALTDVNFAIGKGEVVGVIGRNGAGKSTLLKLLSRITEPSSGTLEIKGRLASLLEVGTGFHPELSGRENIYLNGAILGMSRAEITSKFEEIVEFSGVERFLDTPVKRYSSGMYVRLAFSVAAHLEPEILVIDEVLAVGDREFQDKCLGRMRDVADSGRTVLFVSHNLNAVRNLCSRGLVLKSGNLAFDGDISAALDFYANDARSQTSSCEASFTANHDDKLQHLNARLYSPGLDGEIISELPLSIEIDATIQERIKGGAWVASLSTLDGQELFRTATGSIWGLPIEMKPGRNRITLRVSQCALVPGSYFLGLAFLGPDGSSEFSNSNFLKFEVSPPRESGAVLPKRYPKDAPLWLPHQWECESF